MQTSPRICFAGGGTGGHLFPGLAVAARLAERMPGVRITFAGTGKEFERREVMAAGYAYRTLPCRPLPRRTREIIPFFRDQRAGRRAAAAILGNEGCDLVVGLGGYASAPMARAALARHVPLVCLEQNAFPGRATRWFARRAAVVCTSFAVTARHLPHGTRILCTGNPVRPVARGVTRAGAPQLLVLGGSGGAQGLNVALPDVLDRLRPLLAGWRIVHQTGERDLCATRARYAELGMVVRVEPFLHDLPAVLCESELAVSRAGGTTLAELAAVGLPAVLIPYPWATDDHQRINAAQLSQPGLARMVDQRDPGPLVENLTAALAELLRDATLRARMRAGLRRTARPDAAAEVAAILEATMSCSLAAC